MRFRGIGACKRSAIQIDQGSQVQEPYEVLRNWVLLCKGHVSLSSLACLALGAAPIL